MELFEKQEPKRNQEYQNLQINKRNRNQERNQELQAEIIGSTRNFLVWPVILVLSKNKTKKFLDEFLIEYLAIKLYLSSSNSN